MAGRAATITARWQAAESQMASRLEKAQAAFTEIYDGDIWQLGKVPPPVDIERHIATLIQDTIRKYKIRTVAEFGCGFWNYAKLVDWDGLTYDGYDVVLGPVRYNSGMYGTADIRFHQLTDGVQVAPADLLICKDVLQHLPTEDVLHYLAMFKELFSYMLIFNASTPPDNLNGPIEHGGFRPLRLDLAPFNETVEIVDEWDGSHSGAAHDEQVCLLRGKRRQPGSMTAWVKGLLKGTGR